MFKIESFTLGPLQTNCYLLTEETGQRAFIVDPGMGPKRLVERIKERGLTIEAIVLTHAHFDHMAGVDEVRRNFGCPVYLHDAEADWLTDARKNGSARWEDVTPPLTTEPAEYALSEGQQLQLIGHTFRVMHTPGHSPGSVSLLCGEHLLSGDVLFRQSVGRTDLPGGKERDLYDSIRTKLYKLDPGVRVYPGHGPQTTIGYEMANNPFVPA
ncbi:glyoxylase-like metal-dependent hydrolase (beta-lactamase superfamily II) [Paenibacillus taihuensis]|uniref:Glyoxylase-like metal-dependent hydrolase (Beta-lactamase superfamily II) n=1 Tax=Paenibacillus taihuensis TaxID=1156355 RepID=A0A3D9SQ64_9BACL|nr:MBL fold metallo-hydrolase [Paenibacillus taihuensis]REE92821.1 glyoxylase-like metal-dependent hydrolase (beta-lactamase superfamily II) [Paenibacillus taihuensis]